MSEIKMATNEPNTAVDLKKDGKVVGRCTVNPDGTGHAIITDHDAMADIREMLNITPGSCSKCDEPLNASGDCMNERCSIHFMSFPETMPRTPDDEEDAEDMIRKGFGDR